MRTNNPEKDVIEAAARVMAESFMDYPLNKAVFDGIPSAMEIMLESSASILQGMLRNGTIHLLDDDPLGVVLGYESAKVRPMQEAIHKLRTNLRMVRRIPKENRKTLIRNFKTYSKVMDFKWPKRHLKTDYYYIKVVALDQSLRGSGAFRRLISPILEEYGSRGMPVALETHDERVESIYSHFGFQTVEVVEAEGIQIKQYCMVRWPDA